MMNGMSQSKTGLRGFEPELVYQPNAMSANSLQEVEQVIMKPVLLFGGKSLWYACTSSKFVR